MPTTQRNRRQKTSRVVARPLGALAPQPRMPTATTRRVVIATDGSRAASAALKFARLMAAKGEWTPEVLTVMMPLPVSVGDMVLPAPSVQYEALATEAVDQAIRRQVRRHGDAAWRLTTEFGRTVPVIVKSAHDHRASLIVLGLGHHGPIARMFGAETAIRVIRHTDIPVLAVHAAVRRLPNVAVVATDFSDTSLRAAREAVALLEPPGRLHLVHVKWSHNLTSFADSEWERAYATAADAEFARLRDHVGERAGISITTTLLTGSVVEQVLKEAVAVRAQMIALGSHSQNVLDRLVIGSTPAEVLRSSPCSVLVVPPGAHA
jgi:nucleotide-binding universal stress UspA family protein